jgi:hypothetical protein
MSNTLSGPLDENADRELIIDLRLNFRKRHCHTVVLRIRDGSSACREMIYRMVDQGLSQAERLIACLENVVQPNAARATDSEQYSRKLALPHCRCGVEVALDTDSHCGPAQFTSLLMLLYKGDLRVEFNRHNAPRSLFEFTPRPSPLLLLSGPFFVRNRAERRVGQVVKCLRKVAEMFGYPLKDRL